MATGQERAEGLVLEVRDEGGRLEAGHAEPRDETRRKGAEPSVVDEWPHTRIEPSPGRRGVTRSLRRRRSAVRHQERKPSERREVESVIIERAMDGAPKPAGCRLSLAQHVAEPAEQVRAREVGRPQITRDGLLARVQRAERARAVSEVMIAERSAEVRRDDPCVDRSDEA